MSSIGALGSDPSLIQPWAAQQPNRQQSREQAIDDALKAAGVDPSKIPDLRAQIEAATRNAVQATAGTPAQDRQAAIAAVNNVLNQNGVDTAKFRSALATERHGHGHRGHHHSKAAAAGAPEPVVATDPTTAPGNPDSSPGGFLDANA